MDWLGGVTGWSGFFTLLLEGDRLLVLMAGGGLATVLVAAMRSEAPAALRLIVVLIATLFFGAVFAWALDWIG